MWWSLPALGLVWLAFLPNAPYLVTDLMHLQPGPSCRFADLGLFAVFAWTGLFLTVFLAGDSTCRSGGIGNERPFGAQGSCV
ncbi:MAG: DUF1361 domain-containing protein [Anaerolineae bacterium]